MDTKLDAFDNDSNHLKGLGGWLILVGIGITISPFITSYQLYSLYIPIFQDGSFDMLTNPAYTMYIPNFETLIYIEIAINCIIIVASFYLMYLFYSKNRLFPKLYIALAAFYPVFLLADAWAVNFVMPDVPIFDEETIKQVSRSVIGAVIWIPYMLMSERVKLTFVNPQPSINDELLATEVT
ncbi:DUF2569 domain-containing protein [Kangiella geojedonensis]|uniref:DUF2569 domain-containing protein n=1 Tax=Kangiella geojedonensis TaxID=914150 RepID=A0A0F6RDQ5_9GAMM|nr:DUF2569 domain-containing protein [Kangiella geojedonensis]AKE53166.1 hypothetical protein TQ33_2244 [Kangiella geojedonensis]